jgi:hypothetical protein
MRALVHSSALFCIYRSATVDRIGKGQWGFLETVVPPGTLPAGSMFGIRPSLSLSLLASATMAWHAYYGELEYIIECVTNMYKL